MPLYEFKCPRCETRFEALVSLGSEQGVTCEDCGSSEIQKCISSFGIGGGSRIKADTADCTSCTSGSCATCR
ncbi:MAG: zinc ribbon domain-containing protein [Candidatus Aminicenantaceae bacterium]